ncbi:MAG: hypothetical protein J6X55_02505 [Victivallales bacterium]|nr:hypothetical protein [Victivallales bacterium]
MEYREIKERAGRCRMAVIGDFCLDVYWHADMRRSELSRETPHFPLPIVHERMSAGGAGNVVANLLALEPQSVQCLGVFGDDWRGHAYFRILNDMGADTRYVITDSTRCTNTYIKPLRKGIADVIYEDPRLDFTNYQPLSAETEKKLLDALDGLQCDVLCVCDQMPFGCVTDAVREKICQMGRDGMCIVVDSRDRIGLYRNVIVKPNELEARKALGIAWDGDIGRLQLMAERLSGQTNRPAVVTAGEVGCVTADGGETAHIPAVHLEGETDICGAGDTFMASFACAFAAGASLNEAAMLACRASAIVVKKIHTTGTATWNELSGI